MFAKFYSLEWKKSDVEYVERKRGEKSPSSFAKIIKVKSDGTTVYMIPKKNQYIITVKAEDGQLYTEDVYGIIKYYKHDVKITKNFRISFESFMSDKNYSVDNCMVHGIYKNVETFFSV